MRVFSFFLRKVFLRKPILVVVLLGLVFATNYISFTAVRTLVSTLEGMREARSFNTPGTFIANLDPDSNVDLSKISNSSIRSIYDQIENDFTPALFTDGYIADIPNKNGVEVSIAYMNQKYDQINGLKVKEGERLGFHYNLEKSEAIPVLIGRGLADQYPLNSRFSLVDPALDMRVEYSVAGILDRDPAHSNLYALDSKQYYNFSVIVPVNRSFIKQATLPFKINGLMDLTLTNATRHQVNKLGADINNSLHLKFNFFSQQENIDFYKQYFTSSMIFLSVITLIILGAILLLAIWSSLAGVRVMIREFTLNLLVGMSFRRFRGLLIAYYSLLSAFALLAVFTMVSYSRHNMWGRGETSFMVYGVAGGLMTMDWIGIAASLLVDVILVFIVTQCVIWRIKRVPISIGVLQ